MIIQLDLEHGRLEMSVLDIQRITAKKQKKVYFIGGGGSGAHGTFFASDFPKYCNKHGSGYTSAPQVVISGGGWRLYGGGNACEDNATLGATEGMIIIRKNPVGALTYIKGANPFQ